MADDAKAAWKTLLAAWEGVGVLVWWRCLTAVFTALTGWIHVISARGGSAADAQVGQSKQRVKLMPVFGQAPIPHFPVAE